VGRLHLPRAVRVAFWDGIRAGLLIDEAARLAGISHPTALRWFGECGGVTSNAPRAASVPGRYLSLAEREEIAVRLAAGESKPQIAAALGLWGANSAFGV
jgi:transposase, IS30 family